MHPNTEVLKFNFFARFCRTTHEIVCLASSLITLLMHFFPQSVDALEKESSPVRGGYLIFITLFMQWNCWHGRKNLGQSVVCWIKDKSG